MLEEHRIRTIEPIYIKDTFPRCVGSGARGNPSGYGGGQYALLVTTDKGVSGWGGGRLDEEERARFIGVPVAELFEPDTGTAEHAMPLDLALHDLAGQILGQPVWQMLGARGPRNGTDIYTSSIHFEDLLPDRHPPGMEAVLWSCRQDYDLAYRAFKVKIGRGFRWMAREEGLTRDIAVTRAVRGAYSECKILVDANNAYSVVEACRYVEAVADCDLFWIEEPFRENRDDLRRLKEHMARVGCRALLADGEDRTDGGSPPWRYGGYSEAQMELIYALAAEGLLDVYIGDLGIIGYTRWRRLMPELQAAGIVTAPHTWVWCFRPRYVAQLSAGMGNVLIIEGIPGESAGVDYSGYPIIDGRMQVPDTPGFGLPLDRAQLASPPPAATS